MKKFLLIGLTTLLLSGCSGSKVDYEEFRKEYAITSYNDISFDVSPKQVNGSIYHKDYYHDSGNYYSVYNDRPISLDYMDYYTAFGFKFYYDYYEKYDVYDAFGEMYPFTYNYLDKAELFYYVMSEDSSAYKYITGIESFEKNLHLFNVLSVGDYYVFAEEGDTHVRVANTYINYDVDIYGFSSSLIKDVKIFEKLNDTEYFIKTGTGNYRYKYSMENQDNSNYYYDNVIGEEVTSYNEEDYYSIMSLRFAGSSYTYDYTVKKCNEITNDFTFVYEGIKYYARINAFNNYSIPNYFPIKYMMSKDNTYCFILCHKIDDDKNLSNKYYVFKLDNYSKTSDFTEDISIFNDSSPYIYFNNEYKYLTGESLIALTDDYYLTKNKSSGSYRFVTSGNSYTTIDYDKLGSPFLINDQYWFIDKNSNDLCFFNVNTSSCSYRSIESFYSTYFCIYTYNNSLYCMDRELFTLSSYIICLSWRETECIIFNQTKASFILELSTYSEGTILYIFNFK